MNKKIDVITFGDLCVDLIIRDKDVVPEFGQKEKLVDNYTVEMGGSCSIFACQAGKLGLKTAVIGSVGCDSFGELIVDTLSKSGVSTSYIKRDPCQKTGATFVFDSFADRGMLTYTGTIDGIAAEDISDEVLQSVRHLHIGSYFLMKHMQPRYPAILKKLKSWGATVSLDTNWDPEEKWDSGLWEIIPYVDIILPNENEAMALTKETSLEKAMARLGKIVPMVAVKMGKDGAAVYAGGTTYHVSSIDTVKIDAVGAGDSFDGGFIYGFLGGKSLEESARIGCICGSLNTRAAGGTKGQPWLEEVRKYWQQA